MIAQERKTFFPCCLLFCWQSDPLELTARIPVGAYAPGETINVQIDANNKSDQPIANFKVQLIKVSTITRIYLIHLNCDFH